MRARGFHICFAPDLCEPCHFGVHDQCSWDGMPDCLCPDCPPELKAKNRAELDRAVS